MNRDGDRQKVMLLHQAAEQGDARAQRLLALRYWRGRGVEQDYEAAATLMHGAAAQGLSLAQRDLAVFYQNGIGVDRDPARALELYKAAAAQGDPIAIKQLRELRTESDR